MLFYKTFTIQNAKPSPNAIVWRFQANDIPHNFKARVLQGSVGAFRNNLFNQYSRISDGEIISFDSAHDNIYLLDFSLFSLPWGIGAVVYEKAGVSNNARSNGTYTFKVVNEYALLQSLPTAFTEECTADDLNENLRPTLSAVIRKCLINFLQTASNPYCPTPELAAEIRYAVNAALASAAASIRGLEITNFNIAQIDLLN